MFKPGDLVWVIHECVENKHISASPGGKHWKNIDPTIGIIYKTDSADPDHSKHYVMFNGKKQEDVFYYESELELVEDA